MFLQNICRKHEISEMDNFFVSEFQYTEECIPEYLKRWWRENLIVSYADPAPAAHKSQGQQGN